LQFVQRPKNQQKGTVMHIASGLALVRRDPAQSDIATARSGRLGGLVRWPTPERAGAIRTRLRKILPGAILLTVLAALGAMFPILF
jgi:hypothetical protein